MKVWMGPPRCKSQNDPFFDQFETVMEEVLREEGWVSLNPKPLTPSETRETTKLSSPRLLNFAADDTKDVLCESVHLHTPWPRSRCRSSSMPSSTKASESCLSLSLLVPASFLPDLRIKRGGGLALATTLSRLSR